MKILIGLTYYWPNISGVSVYAQLLAEELANKNHKIRVICAKSPPDPLFEQRGGAEIFRIKGLPIGKGFIMPSYWYKSIKQVRWAEVINCHLPSIESFWLALWGKVFGKKVVVTHHCEFMLTGLLSNKLIAILSWPIHFFIYLWADKIIAYTEDYANNSSFLKIFKNKLVFILPPIKINKISNFQFPISKKYIIGYVGRIAWEKGLDRLIEIIPKFKKEFSEDFEMWWIGPYKNVQGDNYYENFQFLISNFQKEIKLIGPIEHDNLNKYYAKMDCLVLPSTDNLETFGIVQAEAMLCGVPVVASNLPGVRVPITMTGMGEVASITDNNDLANKIIKVLKNRNKYIKNAKNLELFDYKKTVDEYEKVFRID